MFFQPCPNCNDVNFTKNYIINGVFYVKRG